jgi:hypothetical protein
MLDEAHLERIRTKKLIEYASPDGAPQEFTSAEDLLQVLHSLHEAGSRWVFRGHADHRWNLEPTLQRRTTRLADAGISTGPAAHTEKYIVEEFQRRAHQYHQYLRNLPRDTYKLEWLALMQHHGAPTRLLDWTKSAYVGAFFAAAAADPQRECAIWAVDARGLKAKALSMLKSSRPDLEDLSVSSHLGLPNNFDRIFLAPSHERDSVIAPIEPFTIDERPTVQQGLFLCSTTLSWPFEMTLKHMIETPPVGQPEIKMLVIWPRARLDLLRELHRMNVSHATLFPGLDGFARSLSNVAELHISSTADPSGGLFYDGEFNEMF